jgi:hypothetical protein
MLIEEAPPKSTGAAIARTETCDLCDQPSHVFVAVRPLRRQGGIARKVCGACMRDLLWRPPPRPAEQKRGKR